MACCCATPVVRAGRRLLLRRAAVKNVWRVSDRYATADTWTSAASFPKKAPQKPAADSMPRQAGMARKSAEFYSLLGKDCVSLAEYTREDIEQVLWAAVDLKQQSSGSTGSSVSIRVGESGSPLGRASEDRSSMRMPKPGASPTGISPIRKYLDGLLSHIIFETPDIHQRLSVEAGLNLLGGAASYLAPGDIHFTEPEALADTMSTFAACSNLLWCRLYNHGFIEQLARECSVPIINVGSARESPVIALSHLLTLYETYGTLRGLTFAWVGPPTAALNSLLLSASHFAGKITVAMSASVQNDDAAENANIGGGLDPSVLTHALRICSTSNAEIHSVSDVQDALWRTHVVFCGSSLQSSLIDNMHGAAFSSTADTKMAPPKPARPKNVKSLVRRDAEDEQLLKVPSLATFMNGKLTHRLRSAAQSDADASCSTVSDRLEQNMFEQSDLEWTFLHSLPRTPKEVSSAVHYGENSRTFSSVANRKWICAALALLLTRPYKPVIAKPNFMDW